MPRPARAMPAVIAVLARGFAVACGIGLAAALPQVLGDDPTAWPDWSRAASAQTLSTEPSALKRLAEPLPFRPEEPGSGRLSEADLARAVDIVAGLEIFFATLAQSDADSQAGPVWRDSEAAYGAAATTLDTALRNGLFRIVVTEDSKFALVRRGDEVWVDSDLAGAWNVERVRRARQEGDDWPDVAALAALLFDHWRIRNAAGTAWMGLQLDHLDVSRAELERGGPVAAAVFTRYGFFKDIYFQAVLLATVTAGSENATLWDERAASIRQDIDTLLRSLATTGLGGDLPTKLRDGWAEYRAQVERTSAERGGLIVAAREPDPALARIGTVSKKPEQEPRPHIGQETVGEETAPERTAPAIETGPADAAEARQARPANEGARDQDYIALLLARAADAVREAEDAKRQADALARQADAANLAAEEARDALAAAQSDAQSDAEGDAAETARLRQETADLVGQLDRARGEQAALREQLAEAEDRTSTAEAAAAEAETARQDADSQVAELDAQLAAAQSDAEATDEETARLRQEAADLATQLDQANSEQAAVTEQLAEAERRASTAEAAVAEAETARQTAEAAAAQAATARGTAESQLAELESRLTAAQSDAEGGTAETARLRQDAADLTGQLDQANSEQAALAAQLAETENRASAAEAATAEAETARQSAEKRVTELETQLAAAQSEAESGAADTAKLRQEAADLAAQLADARTLASATEANGEAAAAEAGARIAALQQQLAGRDADLGRAEAQAASQASALTEAGAEIGRLERQIAASQAAAAEADSAKAALAAAMEATQGEADRAAQAEAAAAASNEAATTAQQDLANREAELADLRDELRALRQEGQASAQSEAASPPSRASAWRADWLAPALAVLLLAAGLAALLAVSRRRRLDRAPVGEASRRASETRPEAAPDAPPAAVAEPPRPPKIQEPVQDAPSVRLGRRSGLSSGPLTVGDRPRPAAPVTSATIVEAVRRQDWASADAQFSQLSGVPSPGLKDLLADPSGELLALACRAADLDRLTFAALYLLQGQGRAVADPEVVAGAVGLFEKTGPAEAQRRLAERRDRGSLSV